MGNGTLSGVPFHVWGSAGLGIVAIWWGEQSWLSRVSKKDAIGSSVLR
jgi:hypothetical protein